MNLSVITVTWNSAELIREQIQSVRRGCKTISCEQIIIDNGSTDDTLRIIQTEFPEVIVLENKENGFGKANNMGVAVATGEWLLFLNPDMRVEEGSLDTMIKWMRAHPKVGIVSPKLVDEHGALNWDATPRRFPRLWEQIALLLKFPHVFPALLNDYLMKDFDPEKEQEVDSVRGSFMLMPRAIPEKLGWAFDPRYFIWYEDVDICREARRLNYTVMYTPVISCIDYVGQSFKKRDTLWKQKNFTRSMLTYWQKWEPSWKWMWIALARPVALAITWLGDHLSRFQRT